MALNGINAPLAVTGFESVLDAVFAKFGASNATRADFFPGPAFLAWGRMGNLKSWAGPLPDYWLADQASLQKLILSRMRSLGMKPVLPCFPGFVPKEIIS
jgi:alpha-N-acetylglucosaminidase